MRDYYILEGHKAVPVDWMTWGRWLVAQESRKVARETIGDAAISTGFLGIDHSCGGGPPLLFETRVFGGALDQEYDHCTTWEEAEAMHAAMCERVRADIQEIVVSRSTPRLTGERKEEK